MKPRVIQAPLVIQAIRFSHHLAGSIVKCPGTQQLLSRHRHLGTGQIEDKFAPRCAYINVVNSRAHVHPRMQTHIHKHSHTRTHTHPNPHAHTHTHTHARHSANCIASGHLIRLTLALYHCVGTQSIKTSIIIHFLLFCLINNH